MLFPSNVGFFTERAMFLCGDAPIFIFEFRARTFRELEGLNSCLHFSELLTDERDKLFNMSFD